MHEEAGEPLLLLASVTRRHGALLQAQQFCFCIWSEPHLFPDLLTQSTGAALQRKESTMKIARPMTYETAHLIASPPKQCTVLIADDHPVMREGLAAVIHRVPGLCLVAQAANGGEAVEKFLVHSPDIALVELRLPMMDGVEVVRSVCEQLPGARLIIYTACRGEEDIYRSVKAGAFGYLLKEAPVEEVLECIRTVAGGDRWISPAVAATLGKRVAGKGLTARELDVIRALTSGKCNKEIGSLLDISESTVKVHVTHILEKLKVTGRTEAIHVAMRRGLVHLNPIAIT